MFKNYFKTAWRNILRGKGFSVINISGLAIGIVCAGLIFLWVEDEWNYDAYFPNRNNIYMVKNQQVEGASVVTVPYTPGPLAIAMQADIPGIKNIARTNLSTKVLFSAGDKSLYKEGCFVDPSFLTLFHLSFLYGNAASAFYQLQSIVITETMAKNLFGEINVTGKQLRVNNKNDYTITGVIKDLPENISLKFDYLMPYALYEKSNTSLKDWGNQLITWVELQPQTNVNAINKKLSTFVHDKQSAITNEKMMLYPLGRLRLYNTFDNSGNETEGRIKYIRLFSIIAGIILIIACINFMNLATARGEKRSKEVGVRKVLGATKGRLTLQFMGEAVCLSFIATWLAVVIMYLLLPLFNTLAEKNLSLHLFYPLHFSFLIIIALACGLLAGSYPALYLAAFKPILVLKGLKIKYSGEEFVRKGLVVMQFAASVIFIVCAIVVYQQVVYFRQRDIGFNRQNLIYSSIQGNMKKNFASIKNDLIASGAAENASLSISNVLTGGYSSDGFSWEGKDPGKPVLVSFETVSPEYINTTGMQLIAGSDFDGNIKNDSNRVIINETLAKLIGRKNIIGSLIDAGNQRLTVTGVVKDFTFGNVFKAPVPAMLIPDTTNVYTLTIRLKKNADLQSSMAAITKVMKADNPGYPFEYNFLDNDFDAYFKTEALTGKLAGVFSALAIIISCLGLFGLAVYTAERRTKEIGIRKVLGASVSGITTLLSKEFF